MSLCCCAHVISTIPEASTTSRTALRQPRVDGTPAWTACLVRDARGTVSAASCMQKLGGGRLRIAHGPARGSVREEAVLDLCLQALNIKLGPTLQYVKRGPLKFSYLRSLLEPGLHLELSKQNLWTHAYSGLESLERE